MLWFLKRIPLLLCEKIIRKHNIELNISRIINFKAFALIAIKYYKSDQANKEIMYYQDYSRSYSILVNSLQAQITTEKDLTSLIPIYTDPD